MHFDFKDKAVLITGAGRGVGKQVGVAFAKAGAKVIITARSLDRLDGTEIELNKLDVAFIKLKLDVTSYNDCEKAVRSAVKKFGKIDYLINNAAGYLEGWDLRQFSPEDIEAEINSTYKSVIFMTKAVLEQFISQGNGTIVNIASGSGLLNRETDSVVYAADKSAVIRFSERMHKKLLAYGVRVCCVVPWNIRENNFQREEAVSEKDVANAILMACLNGDNLALQTIILEPGTIKTDQNSFSY